jgi:glutamate N-acetyltransferase / amino-acid N-acetyltransferase
MAVGEHTLGELLPVPGLRLATVSAGIKKPGRKDLVLLELASGSHCVGVFTRNAFCAAPVTVAKANLQAVGSRPAWLLVNTGNANAGTGERGLADARRCAAALAEMTGVEPEAVLPFSTGVIGEPLPVQKIIEALPNALLDLRSDGWLDAAHGIMTTDTRPKAHSLRFHCEGRDYVLTGIAKGAGMIRPNMATMLAYLATDAAVSAPLLQTLLSEAAELSFNRITIDGDTSTNDACMLVATGAPPAIRCWIRRMLPCIPRCGRRCKHSAWNWLRAWCVMARVPASLSPCRSTVGAASRNAWMWPLPSPTRRW